MGWMSCGNTRRGAESKMSEVREPLIKQKLFSIVDLFVIVTVIAVLSAVFRNFVVPPKKYAIMQSHVTTKVDEIRDRGKALKESERLNSSARRNDTKSQYFVLELEDSK